MKKLLFLLLLIPCLATAGPLQQKHLAVIAALNSGSSGGSETRRPTSDIYNDMTASAGSNFECVDEESANGDTDYVSMADAAGYERYGFTAFTIPADATNIVVTVYATLMTVSGNLSEYLSLRIGTTTYKSTSDFTDYGTYTEISAEWTQNPATTAAWLYTDINGSGDNAIVGFGPGFEGMEASTVGRVTQTYMVVTYD